MLDLHFMMVLAMIHRAREQIQGATRAREDFILPTGNKNGIKENRY
jgi:hypothetical protein